MTGHRPLVALLVAAGLLAACASDDGDGTGATGPDVTFATTPSGATTPATDAATTEAPASVPAATGSPATEPAPATSPPATAPASTMPPTTVSLGDPVVGTEPLGTFDQPTDIAWRAGDPTMFVVDQPGRVVPVRDGATGDPVLDITDLTSADGERGLLGLTFSPDGGFAYVDYTNGDGDTVIAEYAVADDGTFDAATPRVLLTIDQPYANHNGGNVAIGPDGLLYIGMGDGGSGGDPERHALDLSSLLGKILRIDPAPGDGVEYTVPPDNPFVGVDGALPEIWSVGLRNPWRFSFDGGTGDLWIADVGQGDWEEVDVARAAEGGGRGVNFGWSAFEGTHPFNTDQPTDGVTMPVYEYQHGDAGCSISGGAVYRGSQIPALVGWYVFGDYCSGRIVGLRLDGGALAQDLLLTEVANTTSVRAAPDGELYATSAGGAVVRLVAG